jgi:hypothetical protein
MGESNMYIATGSLVYLNYETIADGRWYYAAGLDMAAVAGLAYGDNTVFKAVWPYVLYPLFFSYPVYALVEGYIINDTGKVIRGWIGFAFCLFTYGAWKSFDDCKLDEKYENKPGAFNILPVLTTEFSGLSASLIF